MRPYLYTLKEQNQHQHPVSVDLVYQDDNMLVHSIISRPDALSNDHDVAREVLPDHRCYRIGGRIDDRAKSDVLRPKYGDRILHCIYPACFITPTRPTFENEMFEFGPSGHLGHGSDFGEAHQSIPLSAYEFRQQRPEMEQMWYLEQTAVMRSYMPLLGVHLTPDRVPTAVDTAMDIFAKRLDQSLGNGVDTLTLVYAQHFAAVRLLDIGQHLILDNAVQKIPFMLGDKLLLSHASLKQQLIDAIKDLSVIELRQTRNEAVMRVMRTWMEENSINRVVEKFLGDKKPSYMAIQLYNLWEHMMTIMEQSVYDSIEEHK